MLNPGNSYAKAQDASFVGDADKAESVKLSHPFDGLSSCGGGHRRRHADVATY